MSVKLLLVLVAAGCGRIGFDPAGDAAATIDVPLGSGPFGPPMLLDINSASADDDPGLSGDALEMYFDSERDGVGDLYVTKRDDRSSPWSTPLRGPELTTPSYDEDGPMLSADALMLTFGSDRPPHVSGDMNNLFATTRPSRSSAWAAPQQIIELSSPDDEAHMPITADKRYAVFCSQRDGSSRLYFSRRASITSAWEPPQPIVELDDGNAITSVTIDATGTYLVFASNRPGGAGNLDLYTATRSSLDEPWGTPAPLVELNSELAELDPSISADRHVLAFVRGTANNSTDRDLYISER